MNEHSTKKRPALDHLFFWFMFAQGGVIAALLIPVHILVQGILGPLGIVPVVDRHYDTWINILGNPLVKLYILVLIAFPFFHFAHRLRYLLVDLGVPAAKSLPAQAVFYGGAVVISLITIWLLLTTAPLSVSHSSFDELIVQAVEPGETPIGEWDLHAGGYGAPEVAALAAQHLNGDTAYIVSAKWDLWSFDIESLKWQQRPEPPTTRSVSVRVFVLPPGARFGGLGFRRSFE